MFVSSFTSFSVYTTFKLASKKSFCPFHPHSPFRICLYGLIFFLVLGHMKLLFLVLNLFIFGHARSFLLCRLFSNCSEQRLVSSCRVRTSPCGGFSCCGPRAPGHQGFSSCCSWAQSCSPQALEHKLHNCGTWAWLLCRLWSLPRSGIKPMSPALARGFLTTEPLGKPQSFF